MPELKHAKVWRRGKMYKKAEDACSLTEDVHKQGQK